MKVGIRIVLGLVMMTTFSVVNAQTFSVSTDSAYCIRQVGSVEDTATVTITNNTSNQMQLKFYMTYEDLSPNYASISHMWGYFSTLAPPPQFWPDSAIIPASSTYDILAIFQPQATLPIHKVRLHIFDVNDSINNFEDLTFASYNCSPLAVNIIVDPLAQYCSGDSAYINANNNYSNYTWYNGDTSQTTHVIVDNTITISAFDSVGCTVKDTLDLDVTVPYDEEICVVSVDSATGKNILVWEKTPGKRTEQYYIYKESFVAGVYNLIGFVPYDSLSVFIDNSSVPLQQADSYKISTVDSCGGQSAQSAKHKTIHLTANVGVGGENNLIWDGYQGFTFGTYNILRGPTPGNMTLLTSVANSLFTYSDLTPPAGANYYRIEAVRPTGCTPTQKTYLSSSSNNIVLYPVGINNLQSGQDFSIYPNPTSGMFIIKLEQNYNDVIVNVKSITGSLVLSNSYSNSDKITIDIDQTGFYLVEVITDKKEVITKKLIIQ